MKKIVMTIVALLLVITCTVGVTLAWLTDTTEEVKNTFTVGNIDIDLDEHDYDPEKNELTEDVVKKNEDYKMIPGTTLPKDPYVTVEAGSEACYVFLKVTEAGGVVTYKPAGSETTVTTQFSDFLTYSIDTAVWTQLEDGDGNNVPGVYYCTQDAIEKTGDSVIKNVLLNKQVTVKSEVTKEMMDALEATPAQYPTLTFTAYAVQQANIASAYEAWQKVPKTIINSINTVN